jgi:hypothetical protein
VKLMMKESRKTERASIDIYLNKYVSGIPYLARMEDISRDGMRLAHLIEPRHDAKRVGLQFQLPGSDEVIYAEGEVVQEWAEASQPGSSVRFTLLTERHRRMIDTFVERQADS